MQFRTTFLRAIAQSWVDGAYRDALIKNPENALEDQFGYKWPWSNVCNLTVAPEDNFQWIDENWWWPPNQFDEFKIRVPLDLKDRGVGMNPDKRSAALADLYRQISVMFGDEWDHAYPGAAGKQGPGGAPPVGGFMPNDNDFTSFAVALLGAIAAAWKTPGRGTELTIDAKAALQSIREYQLPWDMIVTIENDKGARWFDIGKPGLSYWTLGKHHVLTLHLPSKPEDMDSAPIALAAYNEAGATYPFTCCC
jgi:ribosomally synthesized peptide (two-chain TOMM family)